MATIRNLLIISICFIVQSCGGGGGNSENFVGGAILSLNATPTSLDTGDQTLVSVELQDIHEDGVALKFQYPKGLSYVADTAFLKVGEQEIDIGPAVDTSGNASTYLVFVITPDLLGNKTSATLSAQLRADSSADGEIGADADVLPQGTTKQTYSFSADTPEFSAEDAVEIQVNS